MPSTDTVPDAPQNLAEVAASTDHTQVTISWSAPASDGGDSIDDYKVFWDSGLGTGSFTELVASTTALSHT
jgi:hypothetical protein